MDIADLKAFYRGFDITAPQGNNAFSYAARSCRSIHVAPLISGNVRDIVPGDIPAFIEVVDGIEVRACGLKDFVHIERPGQDIFVFDNHNHAFSIWAAGLAAGAFACGRGLVHVDQHRDMREAGTWFEGGSVLAACSYASDVLNVGNFIAPALRLGWFNTVIQVDRLDAFRMDFPAGAVLDIDLDVFAPIMEHIPRDVKISCLREWVRQSRFVTVATSPFFMDPAEAVKLLQDLLED